jgi:sugar phosphate isomerase/epimerase
MGLRFSFSVFRNSFLTVPPGRSADPKPSFLFPPPRVRILPMPKFKLAVVASALDPDPRQASRLAREMAFAGLQFDAYGSALRIPDLSATGRREFLHLLSNQSQQLVGLRADADAKGFGPGADVDRLVQGLDRAMEAAKALAAPLICIDLGRLPEPPRLPKPKPKVTPQQAGLILLPESIPAPQEEPADSSAPPPDPAFVAQIDAALGEVGARADVYGITIAFRTDLAGFAALDEALRRVRCPWFGVDLDPVSILRDPWAMDEIFSRLGPLVRHVRARDAVKGADRRTKPAILGRGDVPWRELLANLDGVAYAGWITLDPVELPDRLAGARTGLAQLRAFLQS